MPGDLSDEGTAFVIGRWLISVIGTCGLLLSPVVFRTPWVQPPKAEGCKRCPDSDDKPFKIPDGWNPNDPVPSEKTNCIRCHITAGRELTRPVRDFARSVHDFAKLSCNSCHGGNTKDDVTAHEAEHDFIGTKLSAHMAACSACHTGPAEQFGKSKHYWDLSKRINRDYPVCVDCHGNHDIGKPPADFTLTNVCTDCHKDLAKDRPHTAAIVAENDRLWNALRQVQQKNGKEADPIPRQFRKEVNACRSLTAKFMHKASHAMEAEAKELNGRVGRLREDLEKWLKEQK